MSPMKRLNMPAFTALVTVSASTASNDSVMMAIGVSVTCLDLRKIFRLTILEFL